MLFSKKVTGNNGEELACQYLKQLGYKIVTRNFTIRGGEVDIIAKDKDMLVFVEVKTRFSDKYGLAKESITSWKLHALQKTALIYLQKINWGNKPYRFDLVAIDYHDGIPQMELLKNIT